ncbi:unnamed protein product [Mytilus coruscus]|nr:unnamed protein product [Mytilus coruscus]
MILSPGMGLQTTYDLSPRMGLQTAYDYTRMGYRQSVILSPEMQPVYRQPMTYDYHQEWVTDNYDSISRSGVYRQPMILHQNGVYRQPYDSISKNGNGVLQTTYDSITKNEFTDNYDSTLRMSLNNLILSPKVGSRQPMILSPKWSFQTAYDSITKNEVYRQPMILSPDYDSCRDEFTINL